MGDSQAHTLTATLTGSGPSQPTNGPRVIIESELVLTLEQENRLMAHARQRLQDLESDLGRTNFESQDWLTAPQLDMQQSATTFMGRRHLAHMVAQQRMEWRPHLLGGLYRESNLHLPLTSRIITQQSARAQKSFFGTKPYFATSGLSSQDSELGEQVNSWAHHKLDTEGGITSGLETAIDLAFIQGECVVKTRKHKLTSYFESFRTVAINPETGEPFVAEDGDFIYNTDVFKEQMVPVMDKATGQPVMDETGQPVTQASGKMILTRDGITEQPHPDMPSLMQTVKLNLSKILADRVEARPIYYLDFLCPLDAASVQDADYCAHLYNTQVIEMAHKYLTDEAFKGQDPETQLTRLKRLTDELLPGSAEDRQAAGDRSRSELGEQYQTTGRAKSEPTTACAEQWMWFDPFGDGVMRSIMFLMDSEGRVPIYYNYTANLTDDGLRPLDTVRINPPTGRWHGQGNVERFWNLQIYTDLLINRSLYAESKAARVDFWNPQLTIEGQANPNLKLNWGGTYTMVDKNTKPEDVLKPVYLENIKSANLQNMMQLILQMAQNMSAISNVNDGAMAGMDTAKLATGIRNLEASGEEMFHAYITQLRPALEAIMKRALRIVLKEVQTERPKLIKFFDQASNRLMEIDPLRLMDLDLDIKLEMTTYKGQMALQQAQTGFSMMDLYFAKHPIVQNRLAPFATQALKAMEFKDADKIAAPLTMDEWALMFPPVLPPASTSSLPL